MSDSSRKQKSNAEPPEAEPTRHCFVLCRDLEVYDFSDLEDAVRRVFGPGYSADGPENNIITISRGEETVGFLAHMPAPIPDGEAEDNADRNFLWPNGKEEAGAHRSHVIVTNFGGEEQSPIQSALVVSRLALVALEVFDGIGVYWGNASVCNSRQLFEDFCEDMSEEHVPVPVWLRFQFIRASDEEIGIYTLGMQQFGLMDIEVDRCPWDGEELFEFVSNIAHYLIQSGPVIADGNTVGGDEEQRILVRHRPSLVDEDRLVYKIVFDQ